MKPSLTLVTRAVLAFIAFAVICVCGILLPELAREEAVGKANPPSPVPFLIVAWAYTVPIFLALHQTFKLTVLIDKNKAFSPQSLQALRNIKSCALTFGVLVILGIALVVIKIKIDDPTEDVTAILVLGFIFTFITSVIATFVAVISRLLQEAITLKKTNDLII